MVMEVPTACDAPRRARLVITPAMVLRGSHDRTVLNVVASSSNSSPRATHGLTMARNAARRQSLCQVQTQAASRHGRIIGEEALHLGIPRLVAPHVVGPGSGGS